MSLLFYLYNFNLYLCLFQIIAKELFSLFTADEFSLLINGVDKIDVADWRKNTVVGFKKHYMPAVTIIVCYVNYSQCYVS